MGSKNEGTEHIYFYFIINIRILRFQKHLFTKLMNIGATGFEIKESKLMVYIETIHPEWVEVAFKAIDQPNHVKIFTVDCNSR